MGQLLIMVAELGCVFVGMDAEREWCGGAVSELLKKGSKARELCWMKL